MVGNPKVRMNNFECDETLFNTSSFKNCWLLVHTVQNIFLNLQMFKKGIIPICHNVFYNYF